MKKTPASSVNAGYRRDMAHLQKLVRRCLRALDKAIAEMLLPDGHAMAQPEVNLPHATWLWGAKENAVSVLTRLAQLQLKLWETEQAWREAAERSATENPAETSHQSLLPLNDEEWALVERMVGRRKQAAAPCEKVGVHEEG